MCVPLPSVCLLTFSISRVLPDLLTDKPLDYFCLDSFDRHG